MSFKERIERERKSHEDDDVLQESIKLKAKFAHITQYPGIRKLMRKFDDSYQNLSGKIVLDYGCGKGLDSLKLLKAGATVYGIDIAENYINETITLAEENGFSSKDYNFQVMDAHDLKFENNKFDLVIGNGILHHLDKLVAINSIYKVLKPGGRLVFKEPLADNPLLKIFRFFTPKARTVDEEPFSKADLVKIIDHKLWETDNVLFCGIISAPLSIITSYIFPKNPDNFLLKFGDYLERKINKLNYLISWNQYVLFDLKKK